MRNPWKSVFGLCVIGMGLGVSAPAPAASANGPYYATPSWDQKLDAATRFIVLLNWNSEAVLDRETGVVWDRTFMVDPKATPESICFNNRAGGRGGWRLPSLPELMSLADALETANHPFLDGKSTGGTLPLYPPVGVVALYSSTTPYSEQIFFGDRIFRRYWLMSLSVETSSPTAIVSARGAPQGGETYEPRSWCVRSPDNSGAGQF